MGTELQKKIGEYRHNLATRKSWQARALEVLWERQTAVEQDAGATVEHNSQGFNSMDANILTSLRNQLASRRALSDVQWRILAKLLPKYAAQLVRTEG